MSDKTYIQGGADYSTGPSGKKTKARLKQLIQEDPSLVRLYSTSSMGPQFQGTANNLPSDAEFSVVGPNPYSKRDWYATVKRNPRGELVCT